MIATIFVLTLRQLLSRRRLFVMLAFGLLPIGIAVVYQVASPATDPQRWTARVLMNLLVVTTLLPLAALVFGTSALGGEIEDGTAVYLLAKPVPRWKVVVAKVAAAWLVTAVLVLTSTAIAGGIAINDTSEDGIVTGFALAVALGSLAYVCVFVLLSVFTSRALITGLIYVFFWESVVTGIFSGTRVFSIRQYTLGIARWASTAGPRVFDARMDGTQSLILAAVVSALATTAAVWRLRRFEIGEST